jgi:hypothetical protein
MRSVYLQNRAAQVSQAHWRHSEVPDFQTPADTPPPPGAAASAAPAAAEGAVHVSLSLGRAFAPGVATAPADPSEPQASPASAAPAQTAPAAVELQPTGASLEPLKFTAVGPGF